jgi:hypothetical protein
MEHIVRSLVKTDELADYVEEGFEDDMEELDDIAEEGAREDEAAEDSKAFDSRASSRANRRSKMLDVENVSPEMEARLLNNPKRNSKRFSQLSVIDVADRHLRERTDAIAHIIRNIADQCAAAVEGLQLAHDAEVEAEELALNQQNPHRASNLSNLAASDDGNSAQGSDVGDDSLLHPGGRASSIPPTPDLVHNRSSTSMSIASSTTTPERSSQQYNIGTDIPTKIVEDDDGELSPSRSDVEAPQEPGVVQKGHHESLIRRPAGARISALGGH